MIDKKELQKMIDKKQELSDRNFENYQETGESRYYRAHSNAEQLIDIFKIALNAADEHQKLVSIQCQLAALEADCEAALSPLSGPDRTESVMRELIALCRIYHI